MFVDFADYFRNEHCSLLLGFLMSLAILSLPWLSLWHRAFCGWFQLSVVSVLRFWVYALDPQLIFLA